MSQSVESEVTTEDNFLGMSDEDFANMDPADYEEPVIHDEEAEEDDLGAVEDTTEDADEEENDTGTNESGDAEEDGETNEDTTDDEDAEGETDKTDSTEDTDTEETGEDEKEEKDEDGKADSEKDEETDKESEVDYKAEYEKLMAPFRANGKDMSVSNIDEVRQLMQMGANYNKKMAALKPSLKTLKLLENNDLMGEEKLSYLIDLHKGDKGAIQKLIKDSGIDPLDMDVETDSDYEPNTYTVDDRELALDEVLEKIQDTPTYSDTVNVVSNKWDKASKQTVADNPQLLEVINSHMANGIYERVSNEVEKERTFGRLNGLSDLEAYRQVGDSMAERGAFNDLSQNEQNTPPAEKQKVAPKPKAKAPSRKLKDKKRAASSTNAKPAATAPDLNPLGMSDEEFDKQYNTDFL